jgi:O-antigen ligase
MSNASALFRSLLIYGLCLPLAVFLGYLLATPLDITTIMVVVFILSMLAIPLLLRWHHAWLIATWNMSAVLFFVPGRPPIWMALAAISLGISILQYTLNRKMKFLHAPSIAWPLILLTVVIFVTARLTGGLSIRLFGGTVYGGKKYFTILAAVIGFFAIINRQIPPKRANLYIALFFLGAATVAIGELPGVLPPVFDFLFAFFPMISMDTFIGQNDVIAQTSLIGRQGGVSSLGVGGVCAMLACYGIRGILDARKPWRLGVFCLFFLLTLLGGFRSTLIMLLMTLALLFYLERLHHTWLLLPMIFVSLLGGGLIAAFASHLPLTFQRSLAFVPFLQIDPIVKMDAQSSTEWRLQLWRDVAPQIPQYLLVGKGYSFSGTEHQQLGWETLEGFELVGDYHNGPLSVILPFGIFGSIAFVWLMVAGIRVIYQNYHFGDPDHHTINTFLFAYFVVKAIFFFTIFGSLHSDLPMFLGMLGLSISINGGVAKPEVVPQQSAIVFNRFKLNPSARRPAGAS